VNDKVFSGPMDNGKHRLRLRHHQGERHIQAHLPAAQQTIMNLTTQDGQVACFQNVAAHLQPGGCFVIEVMVPELQRLPPGETVRAFTVTPDPLGLRRVRRGVAGPSLPPPLAG
jgi:hypothetical protein